MRSYSTAPQVWGGDPEHGHAFGDPLPAHKPGQVPQTKWANVSAVADGQRQERGAFCPCAAWRGELGSEPTPALFIEHLLTIFDEVWRVLRKDGLVFCNIGDSYSGSGKGPSSKHGLTKQHSSVGSLIGPTPIVPGIPAKNLLLIPQRFAIGMQERGWIVRSEIAWAKKSSMPESVKYRPTSAWEPIWMFAKSAKYFYDSDAVRTVAQPMTTGRNPYGARGDHYKIGSDGLTTNGVGSHPTAVDGHLGLSPAGASLRNVWLLGPSPFADAHFATFPPEIPRRAILAGTSQVGACPACGAGWVRVVERTGEARQKFYSGADQHGSDNRRMMRNGQFYATAETTGWQPGCSCDAGPPIPQTVLDPFGGSGTTGLVADRLGRDAVLIELNPEYAEMARRRIESDAGSLFAAPVQVEAPTQGELFAEEAN